MSPAGEFSGVRFAQNVDDLYREYREMRDKVVDWYLEDGPPPGYQDADPYFQLQRLRALRMAQSNEFWNDPAAQRELEKLELRYG